MIAVGVIAAAILQVAPAISPETRERYAEDIAASADDLETGLALVATASVESGFRETIERCHCAAWECDGGKAFGLYQLHKHWLDGHTSAEVCRSNRLATELAAAAIVSLRARYPMRKAFARYVGAAVGDPRVAARWVLFKTLRRIYTDA
jgi:hypothetical protein